jgi:orotate phosphoribosyltransferase-like protein
MEELFFEMQEIKEKLDVLTNLIKKIAKSDNDFLTAEEISKEYNINYEKVLSLMQDKRMRVYRNFRPYKVFRKDFLDYLKSLNS